MWVQVDERALSVVRNWEVDESSGKVKAVIFAAVYRSTPLCGIHSSLEVKNGLYVKSLSRTRSKV